jgi:hypothetical protein
MPNARSTYEAKALLATIPNDRAELFIGYSVPAVGSGWREGHRAQMRQRADRPISRSIWTRGTEETSSVVIDIAECASSAEAIDELMERLDENELARLDPGPPGLGHAAFAHPRGVPAALFFARANLTISIVSKGTDSRSIDDWVAAISAELEVEARDGPTRLEISRGDSAPDGRITLRYRLPWQPGPTTWFKFVSVGTTIARGRGAGELLLGAASGKVSLRAWAVEPGRETQRGSFEAQL